MSEWHVTHENFHTKHSMFTAPDEHMHTSLSYTLWASNQQGSWTSDQFMTNIGKQREIQRQTDRQTETDKQVIRKEIIIIMKYLLSDRSVLFPTSMIITSLPLSVRTSSIHLDVWWKEFASAKQKINIQVNVCGCVCVCARVNVCVCARVNVCVHVRLGDRGREGEREREGEAGREREGKREQVFTKQVHSLQL